LTTDLFLALQRFRRLAQRRILWADAICINQQDLDERGRQVSIMKGVYEEAVGVLVWLGPNTEGDAASAANMMQMEAEEICRASKIEISTLRTLGWTASGNILAAVDWARLPPGDSEVWQPLVTLFTRP
jgi:hypothetical protein